MSETTCDMCGQVKQASEFTEYLRYTGVDSGRRDAQQQPIYQDFREHRFDICSACVRRENRINTTLLIVLVGVPLLLILNGVRFFPHWGTLLSLACTCIGAGVGTFMGLVAIIGIFNFPMLDMRLGELARNQRGLSNQSIRTFVTNPTSQPVPRVASIKPIPQAAQSGVQATSSAQTSAPSAPHQTQVTRTVPPKPTPLPPLAKAAIPAQSEVKTNGIGLDDKNHPARNLLDEALKIINQHAQLESASTRMKEAISLLEKAVEMSDDVDIIIAIASLYYAGIDANAGKALLQKWVSKNPNHPEVQHWLVHPENWVKQSIFQIPAWDVTLTQLPQALMDGYAHNISLHTVRDGLQRAYVILVHAPPESSQQADISISWFYSMTPYGPLVVYYPTINGKVWTEHFLVPYSHEAEAMGHSPAHPYYIMRYLAYRPYCYLILMEGQEIVSHHRIIFRELALTNIKEIADRLALEMRYIPAKAILKAMQWHMDRFDVNDHPL